MKKITILNKLINSGVIAVIRADSKNEALSITEAIVKGGITGLELTFTIPNAEEIIRELKEKYANNEGIVVGAGTKLLGEISNCLAMYSTITFGEFSFLLEIF